MLNTIKLLYGKYKGDLMMGQSQAI